MGRSSYVGIFAISFHGINVADYDVDCSKKDTHVRVYNQMTNPVPGMHDFKSSSLGPINPPKIDRYQKGLRSEEEEMEMTKFHVMMG